MCGFQGLPVFWTSKLTSNPFEADLLISRDALGPGSAK